MSVPTAELTAAPAARRPAISAAALTRSLTGGRLYVALAVAALVLAALSLLIPSTPSYDPWSWLVWGREIAHANLQTTGGPTWKPLPVIFTTIFSPFGSAAPDLWLVVARAGALMAVAMTVRVAWRLARPLVVAVEGGERRSSLALLPALLAALIAAGSLINSPGFITDNALGYSEGLMTALVLVAFERHLDGARRQAFAIGFFAALDRPELWLLWGPYGLYLWWKDPGARKLVIALFVLIPVLWFVPEYWGSGHFFRGVTRAQHVRSNSAANAKCPFCTEFTKHAWPRVMFRIKLVGLVAMAVAALGLWRTRAAWWRARSLAPRAQAMLLLVVAGFVGWAWWIGVAVLTQAGFSGNDRYLVLGSALVSIAGGVGWGWGAAAVARVLTRRLNLAVAGAIGTAVAIAVIVATPPWIGPSIVDLPATHRALVYQAHLRQDMAHAVKLVQAKRILACGTVMTEGFQVPMLAWNLDVHTARIAASPASVSRPGPAPNVIFQTRAQRNAHLLPVIGGWKGVPYHRVTRVRTFRVFAHCANKVTL
ncbi:MAG TPA: hypothetical protein VGY32_12095 [Solirubrobacteraceae bacterium]|nr:hypothetical protein [Solirubrobacteraceae bacterium]